jgi:hypothetical protein
LTWTSRIFWFLLEAIWYTIRTLDTKRAQGEFQFPGLKKATAVVAHNGIAVAGSMGIWKIIASLSFCG